MEKIETLEEFIKSQPYYGSCTTEYIEGIEVGAKWMYKQSTPHPIRQHHLIELEALYAESKITHSRMVEILNEIAAGKHKEGIEI